MRRKITGVAAVELALLLPVLMALVLAMLEFGRAIYHYDQLVQRVRQSARYLCTGQPDDAQRQQVARNIILFGNPQGAGSDAVHGVTAGMIRILEPVNDAGVRQIATGQGTVSLVNVSIQGYQYTPLIWPAMPFMRYAPISVTMPFVFF